jgi:hypothetical protein
LHRFSLLLLSLLLLSSSSSSPPPSSPPSPFFYVAAVAATVSLQQNLSKVFEIVIHDHLFFYFKFHLQSSLHRLPKKTLTVTNLINKLNTPIVYSKGQDYFIYCVLCQAFDNDPHNLLLNKLNSSGWTLCKIDCFVP